MNDLGDLLLRQPFLSVAQHLFLAIGKQTLFHQVYIDAFNLNTFP
jgi:hypothetical protein